MTNVTCWYRNVETDKAKPPRFEFNHIENGHTDLDAPTPNCDYQRKAWAGVEWKRTRARIENGVVIHNITDGEPTMTEAHTCSYYCECPECVRRQRDELRDRMESALAQHQEARNDR